MKTFGQIIEELREQYEPNSKVDALLVTGSVARGEAQEGDDIDILAVTKGEKVSREYKDGETLVEIGTVVLHQELENIKKNPMKVYMYLDAKAVFDKNGSLNSLQEQANKTLQAYRPTPDEKKALKKWLESVVTKVTVAQKSGDMLKVGFHVSSVCWKMVEGLYMINSMPTPASTSALIRITSLDKLPYDFENLWRTTLLGDLNERTRSTLEIIKFIVSTLDSV